MNHHFSNVRSRTPASTSSTVSKLDALVIGAGFGGIYALYKLRGQGMSVKAIEKADGVGGTWHWNRYPGARCDVPSLEYSYSFSEDLQQEWNWTELHAGQAEIERYANHVVDRFDLRKDIYFDMEVTSAHYDAIANLWQVQTSKGQNIAATYLIMATGGYHTPIVPNLRGLDSFEGELYYSNQYPKTDIEYAAKTVGLIGTGSSGVQTAVALASEPVQHLYVFQRTAGYMVPAHNRPLSAEVLKRHKRNYAERRERARHSGYGVDVTSFPVGRGRTMNLSDEEFESRANRMWDFGGGTLQTAFPDFVTDARANKRISDWLNSKVRKAVNNPQLAEQLCAKGHYIGAKRIIIIDGFTDAMQQPNVSLVDVKASPIEEITPRGVRTADRFYELDMLILATGFDSATGSMLKVDVRGRSGVTLKEKWAKGHRTYLGIGVNGFPNMFMIAQAGSPGIRSHVMVSIEQHVDWISALLTHATKHRIHTIEPTARAEDAWTTHVADVAASTLLTADDTQHLGSNVPGKPRVVTSYLGGVGPYRTICDAVREHEYEGWKLSADQGTIKNSETWSGPGKKIRWEDRDEEIGKAAGFL